LSTVKLVARKRCLLNTLAGSHLETFAAVIWKQILFGKFRSWIFESTTRNKNVRLKSFVKICHTLHLIQAKEIQNCQTLSWLIAGKLSQVGQHHMGNKSCKRLWWWQKCSFRNL